MVITMMEWPAGLNMETRTPFEGFIIRQRRRPVVPHTTRARASVDTFSLAHSVGVAAAAIRVQTAAHRV